MLLALAVVASVASADSPFDPGSGKDASGSADDPTLLPGFGQWSGDLPAGDVDWYGVDTTGAPACAMLTTNATAGHDVTLGVRGAAPHSIRGIAPPGTPVRIALAAPGVTRTLAGFHSATSTDLKYAFHLERLTLDGFAGGDGDTGTDAGGLLSNAMPVKSHCFRGSVGLKDSTDVYAFTVPSPDQVVYSLAASGAASPSLRILDAAGAALGAVVGSGGIGVVNLPSAGTYYLSVTIPLDSSASNYLVGLVGPDPPPGSPCRPYCMVS